MVLRIRLEIGRIVFRIAPAFITAPLFTLFMPRVVLRPALICPPCPPCPECPPCPLEFMEGYTFGTGAIEAITLEEEYTVS